MKKDTIKTFFRYLDNAFLKKLIKSTLLCLLLLSSSIKAGTITVSWEQNTESDLAGYKIYYGKSARNYQNPVYVGNVTSYRLSGLEEGERYYFAVTAVDFSGNESDFSNEVDTVIPDDGTEEENQQNHTQTVISQAYNFPNPFKIDLEGTTIRYQLAESAEITIEILDPNMDLVATLIKNELRGAGEHIEDKWDGRNADGRFVANGVYFCNIRTSREQKIIKIAVTR